MNWNEFELGQISPTSEFWTREGKEKKKQKKKTSCSQFEEAPKIDGGICKTTLSPCAGLQGKNVGVEWAAEEGGTVFDPFPAVVHNTRLLNSCWGVAASFVSLHQ